MKPLFHGSNRTPSFNSVARQLLASRESLEDYLPYQPPKSRKSIIHQSRDENLLSQDSYRSNNTIGNVRPNFQQIGGTLKQSVDLGKPQLRDPYFGQ